MATMTQKRAWLKEHRPDLDVPDRGRLNSALEMAWAAAHPDEDDSPVQELPGWDSSDLDDITVPEGDGLPPEAPVMEETPPRRPRRPSAPRAGGSMIGKLLKNGGGSTGTAKKKPRGKIPRVPVDKFVTRGYLRLGQMASAIAPCTGRCLQAQSAMAGVLLEDITRGTVVDRLIQPLARAEDKLDKSFALVAPPLLVFLLETGDPENMTRRMLLTGLLREALLISMDVTDQYADRLQKMAERSATNEARIDQLMGFIFSQPQAQAQAEPEMAPAAA